MQWFERAKRLSKSRGITYKNIAEVLGITEAAVGHYMNGRREPTLNDFVKIAELLGETMESLYSGQKAISQKITEQFESLSIEQQADIRAAIRVLAAANRSPK